MSYDTNINYLKELYASKISKYGDSPEGACWSSAETQDKRLEILTQIAPLHGKKVLDFGCGTGALAGFLKRHNITVKYYGCDIVESALKIARSKYPDCFFGKFEDYSDDTFDYIFVSGVFNNKLSDNKEYYESVLRNLWGKAGEGMAFNMMSYYVDYYDAGLFYEKPENVFDFVKREISPFLVIWNDYLIKRDVKVPFEFAVYVYRGGK